MLHKISDSRFILIVGLLLISHSVFITVGNPLPNPDDGPSFDPYPTRPQEAARPGTDEAAPADKPAEAAGTAVTAAPATEAAPAAAAATTAAPGPAAEAASPGAAASVAPNAATTVAPDSKAAAAGGAKKGRFIAIAMPDGDDDNDNRKGGKKPKSKKSKHRKPADDEDNEGEDDDEESPGKKPKKSSRRGKQNDDSDESDPLSALRPGNNKKKPKSPLSPHRKKHPGKGKSTKPSGDPLNKVVKVVPVDSLGGKTGTGKFTKLVRLPQPQTVTKFVPVGSLGKQTGTITKVVPGGRTHMLTKIIPIGGDEGGDEPNPEAPEDADSGEKTAGQSFAAGLNRGKDIADTDQAGDVVGGIAGAGKVSDQQTIIDHANDGVYDGAGQMGGTLIDAFGSATGTNDFLVAPAGLLGTAGGIAAQTEIGKAKLANTGVKTAAQLSGTQDFISTKKVKGQKGSAIFSGQDVLPGFVPLPKSQNVVSVAGRKRKSKGK